MSKNCWLNIFESMKDYDSEKDDLLIPNVTYIDDEDVVIYGPALSDEGGGGAT